MRKEGKICKKQGGNEGMREGNKKGKNKMKIIIFVTKFES